MSIQEIIERIKATLNYTFSEIDQWFDRPDTLRTFQPPTGSWSIDEVLEHISLTNHYLLILIAKGRDKALTLAPVSNLEDALQDYHFDREELEEVGVHASFDWIRPEHMEPTGEKKPEYIRELLRAQLKQCLDILAVLPNGEGILGTTTMSVNNLGKLDVYQYIYFLALHAKRHLTQMEQVERKFEQLT